MYMYDVKILSYESFWGQWVLPGQLKRHKGAWDICRAMGADIGLEKGGPGQPLRKKF